MNKYDLIYLPEDSLDRLLVGKATEGDQILAHNAIRAAQLILENPVTDAGEPHA